MLRIALKKSSIHMTRILPTTTDHVGLPYNYKDRKLAASYVLVISDYYHAIYFEWLILLFMMHLRIKKAIK